jgi:carboxypeptidase family protein
MGDETILPWAGTAPFSRGSDWGRGYNRGMRKYGWLLGVLLVCVCAAFAAGPAMTKITISVKTDTGRPVERASVIVRFIQGHNYLKLGKAIRTTYELRTNEEGEARIPEIPQGKIRIQINAKGYQTFGQIFDINEEERAVEIKLNPPQPQYSSHEQ